MEIRKPIYRLMFFIACFLVFSCSKTDKPTLLGTIGMEGPGDPVVITVRGNVENVSTRKSLTDVRVQVGNNETFTNENGAFELKNSSAAKNRVFIKYTKPGYFFGGQTLQMEGGSSIVQSLSLMEHRLSFTVQAGTGGEIAASNNMRHSYIFPSEAFIDEDSNEIYQGSVSVKTEYILQGYTGFIDALPGPFRGIDSNGKDVSLNNYGVIATELFGESNQKLNIAPGKKVKLSFPANILNNGMVPLVQDLWYFDETIGLWKQEGKAYLSGTVYIAEVSHFSYWLIGSTDPLITYRARILTGSGQPMKAGRHVELKLDSIGYSLKLPIDENGYVNGYAPLGKKIRFELHGPGDPVIARKIGPFSENVDEGDLRFEKFENYQIELKGKVTDCNGEPVQNGKLFVKDPWYQYGTYMIPIQNGTYTYSFYRSQQDTGKYRFHAINSISGDQEVVLNSMPRNSSTLVTDIQICYPQIAPYLEVTIEERTVRFEPPMDTLLFRGDYYNPYIRCVKKGGKDKLLFSMSQLPQNQNTIKGDFLQLWLENFGKFRNDTYYREHSLIMEEYGEPFEAVKGSFNSSVYEWNIYTESYIERRAYVRFHFIRGVN
jgi:hypothetical protein